MSNYDKYGNWRPPINPFPVRTFASTDTKPDYEGLQQHYKAALDELTSLRASLASKDALLEQAREALSDNHRDDDGCCNCCGHSYSKHARTCEVGIALAAIEAHKKEEK